MCCSKCEEYLSGDMEIVISSDCGQLYMMHNSVFHECKLKKGEKGGIVAFIKGKEVKLNSKEEEVIKSLEIIRLALPFEGDLEEGEELPARSAMPFPGTEALLC